MTEPFRWKNCYADVASSSYGDMAQSYLSDVVEPTLAALEKRISELRELSQHDDLAVFALDPAEELLRTTMMGYCLAIQSLWEKQIRGYLQRAAREFAPNTRLSERVQTATWDSLGTIFNDLRGVPLTAFDEFADLNMLRLLGNVCRHGDGPSMQRLAAEHPELWPTKPEPELVPPLPGSSLEPVRTADSVTVSLDLLRKFASAIDSFWRETEYIHNESIDRKHPSLEARLVEERRLRAGGGRPWDPP